MPLYLIAKPETLAVTLDDIKTHLRGFEDGHTDEDDRVLEHLEAQIDDLDGDDGWLGRALVDQTWELRLDNWCCGRCLKIPLPPLIEVVSVKYYDGDNTLQTFSADNYRVIGVGALRRRGRIELVSTASWPTVYSRGEAVIVQFRAGYLDTTESPAVANVPKPIKQAIKLKTQFTFEGCQDEGLIETADLLLSTFRDYSH